MTASAPARHILSMAQHFAGGGVERVLLSLARGWLAEGRRVTLVVGDPAGPLADERPAGAEIVVLGDGRYRALIGGVPRAIRRARPDVVFVPGNHYTAVGAWTRLSLAGTCPPIVAKVSNALVRRDMRGPAAAGYAAWLRAHPWFLDRVVAMTPGMAEQAARAMRLPRERIAVIANPPPQPAAGAVPVALPGGRYLLGIGRLAPQKRWDRAIAALARLADRGVALVILGEGSERDALAAQAAALGLGDRVHLPGYAADPAPAIAAAAAVVLTSDYEGAPGVLREALAAGTPVVATDASVAVREIVAGPDRGEIVAPDDADALVAALDRRLRPGAARPAPIALPADSARDYLRLFDSLVASSSS